MSVDPYRDWLHIPQTSRPLNHYELLGLAESESEHDAGRIQTAYGQRMEIVRRYQVGAHMEVAQRVVSELSEAFATLTHPQQRQAYDTALRGGPTYNGAMQTVADVPIPPPTNDASPPPSVTASGPAPSVPKAPAPRPIARSPIAAKQSTRPPGRRKQKPSPALVGSIAGGAGLLLLGLIVGLAGRGAPAKAPLAPPAPSPAASTQTAPPTGSQTAPSQRSTKRQSLEQLLTASPAIGSDADFTAVLHSTGEGEVAVRATPDTASRSVRVTFPGATPAALFDSRRYLAGDEVEVLGKFAPNAGGDPPWLVVAEALQRRGAPNSRIDAKAIADWQQPPPASPSTTGRPNAAPASQPAARPTAAPAAAPSDPWVARLAAAERAWKQRSDKKPGETFPLAATFVEWRVRLPLPPELRLRLQQETIAIEGSVLAPAEQFLQQLTPNDRMELQVVVVQKQYSQSVELEWVARAGAAEAERVPCRTKVVMRRLYTLAANLQRPIKSLAWSPDGSQIVVAAKPTTLWDATTGQNTATLSQEECLNAAWSFDGRYVALVEDGSPDRVAICDLTTGKKLERPTNAVEFSQALAFHPKRLQLVFTSTSQSSYMSVTSLLIGKQLKEYSLGDYSYMPRVAWNADGSRLMLGAGRSLFIFSDIGGKLSPDKNGPVPLTSQSADLRFVGSGKQIAMLSDNRELTIGDPYLPDSVLRIPDIRSRRNYSPSPDGSLVAVVPYGTDDLQVWNVRQPAAPAWQVEGNFDGVSWSPEGAHLAVRDSRGMLWLFDPTGVRLGQLQTGATYSYQSEVAWAPVGGRLATFEQSSNPEIYSVE